MLAAESMPYPALWPQNGLWKKYFLLFESWKEFFSSSVLRYNGSPVPLCFLSYLLAESLVLVPLNRIGVGRLWLEVWLDHLLTAEPWACLSRPFLEFLILPVLVRSREAMPRGVSLILRSPAVSPFATHPAHSLSAHGAQLRFLMVVYFSFLNLV